MLLHTCVGNVASEANRVGKKCEEGSCGGSAAIEARGPRSPGMTIWQCAIVSPSLTQPAGSMEHSAGTEAG